MIYELAGLRVNIKNRCRYTGAFCAEYLSADQSSPAAFEVAVTNEGFYEEKKFSENFSDGYIENICLYRKICLQMPLYDRFLLHSAVLTFEGQAYAFLGKSGIGKSTHVALWTNHVRGAEVLNGDKPLVHKREDGTFVVYGTPWNGKENLGRKGSAPLRALTYIERAEENTVERIDTARAADRLFSQILLPTETAAAEKTLELADSLVRGVPSYVLGCNMRIGAAETSFCALTGKDFSAYRK